MKKSLLTLVSVMLTTMSALAQWVEPSILDIETTDMATDGTPQFLLNKDAKGFFGGGNDWNTRASVSPSVADSVKFVLADEASATYQFCDYPIAADKKAWCYVSCNYDEWKNHWVDASNAEESTGYPGTNKWKFVKQANGSYKFYNVSGLTNIPEMVEGTENGYLGIAEKFEGAEGNTRCFLFDAAATYTYEDEYGEEQTNPTYAGAFWDEWFFVSIEAYEAYYVKRSTYDAAVALNKAIEDAKATYDGINLTDVEAVFNDYTSTLETLKNALEVLLPADIEAYVNAQIEKASLDNPVDVTSRIGYVEDLNAIAAGNGSLPKNGWVSTKTEGNFHINTWSVEGNSDGTNMVTPFIEYWKGAGNKLDNQKFYRDPAKDAFIGEIPAGAYKITANIRIYNESGAEYVEGAYLFGNINRTSLTKPTEEGETPTQANAIDGAVYGNYNGMLLYWKDGFETYAIVPEANSLIFGVQTQDVNFNWVASKDFKVAYLGSSYESLDFVRKNTDLIADSYDEEVIAQKSLVAEYNAAINSYKTATTAEALTAAYAKVAELQDSVASNIAAYNAYIERLEYISNYMGNEGSTLEGPDVDLLTDYLDGDEGPTDDYPNGFSKYILAELTLDTPEIEAELEFLENLYATAVRNGMSDGTDLTSLIVNPGFEEAGGKGWTSDPAYDGPNDWHGGNSSNYGAEAWNRNFDVYQIIEDVPNGLYEVSVQAFYRTASNQAAYDAYVADPKMEGDAKVLSYVYFNNFASPVKNVMEIQYDENLANNCWTVPGTDPQKFTLNGMASASAAFSLADESVNFTQKVYGLVTDGIIRLGIRNTEGTVYDRWTLWDNFKLVYRAKNPIAVAAVLEAKIDEYSAFETEQSDNELINSVEKTLASNAIDNAETALGSGDVDKMWDALIAINDAYVHTQEHVALMKETKDVMDELTNAINEYSETASADALAEAQAILLEGYDEYTNEELAVLNAKAKDAIAKLKIPDTTDASDDNPVDFTDVIVNHDIEQGATVGWTYTKTAQNGPNLDAGINGKSIEFWNPSASGTNFNIYQKISYLPAGKYELSFDASNSLNGESNPGNGGRAFLYAATYTAESDTTWFSSAAVEPQPEGCTEKYNNYSVIFTLNEGEDVTIGAKSSGTMDARWFVCDNFKLMYYGAESAKEDSGNPMSVDGVEVAEGAQIVAIYTVSGAPVATLQKGLNIVKYADGSVKKIFVK